MLYSITEMSKALKYEMCFPRLAHVSIYRS